MGIDARIHFKGIPPLETWLIDQAGTIEPLPDYLRESYPEATHRIEMGHRYYGLEYERGPWPVLASALMVLMMEPAVEKVWYGGDGFIEEMTPDKLCEITRHYITNGHRPYDAHFERKTP